MSCIVMDRKSIGVLAASASYFLLGRDTSIYRGVASPNMVRSVAKAIALYDLNGRMGDGVTLIALAMEDMNSRAFHARYGHGDGILDYGEMETGHSEGNLVKLLKSLQCFLYQCSEGEVPYDPLYKALREFENVLKDNIIVALPEYQEAPWA